MATLSSLPNELIIDIAEYLLPFNEHEPITGFNGAWKKLSAFRASLRLQQPGPEIDQEKSSQKAGTILKSPLNAFRVTCSRYNELCKPILHQNFNILYNYSPEETSHLSVLQAYPQRIRSIRLLVTQSNVQNKVLSDGLGLCRNVTSIGLYYDDNNSDPINNLVECILDLIENASLQTLGIYSNRLLEPSQARYVRPDNSLTGAANLLNAITRSPKARKLVTALDVVTDAIPQETYDLIRSALLSLRSLTVRRAFRFHLPRIWDQPSAQLWINNPNLTRLQFLVCDIAYAPHIPYLVRQFPSLEHLTVSTCGQWGDEEPPPPNDDRHSREDALSKVRRPLKSFHIEHTADWEIAAMGDIPAETVIFTNIGGEHIVKAFRMDPKLFPSLRCLRLESHCGKNGYRGDCGLGSFAYKKDAMTFLQEACAIRGVELRQDAQAIKPFPRHIVVAEEQLENSPNGRPADISK